MIQNSYSNDRSTLFIVPTPIGNMDDITLRAKEILSNVSVIFAEDTRVCAVLLDKLHIKNKIKSCHKFNEISCSQDIIKYLSNGKNVALVTDRGTPLISDPGYIVTREVINECYNVVALPGASALLPALNMSGINAERFLFYGFLSSKQGEQIKELEMLSEVNFTIVLYEAPHRLLKTLQNMKKILGNNNISISREISKVHEEVFRGSISEAIDFYKEVKGEVVIVIEPNVKMKNYEYYFSLVKELVSYNMSSKDAIKYISNKYNVSKNILYKMNEDVKK